MPGPTERGPLRLGPHHFAHLRAVAQGIDLEASAVRYLGVSTLGAARRLHRTIVDTLRAVARRRGDGRWRLIGLQLAVAGSGAGASAGVPPPLDEWAAEQGLDGWSHAELLELHREAFPEDRRQTRNRRLRQRQLDALAALERVAGQAPTESDRVDGWYAEPLATRLITAGYLTLGELQRAIGRGGRWYAGMPGVGVTKAQQIRSMLEALLGQPERSPVAVGFVFLNPDRTARQDLTVATGQPTRAASANPALDGSAGTNRAAPMAAGVRATDDLTAIRAWLEARTGTPGSPGHAAGTARIYRSEAERFLLWCLKERGKPLSSVAVDDARAYMDFLARIPDHWISRRHARRLAPGWAPFAGQLSSRSQAHAVTIVKSLFDWLVSAGYLQLNPWRLIKTRLGEDRSGAAAEVDTRALSPAAWEVLVQFVEAAERSPARERLRFVLTFGRATGLRAAEMLGVKLGDLRGEGQGWVLPVNGKGARNRVVAVPEAAIAALERYLEARGLGTLDAVQRTAPDLPMVASTIDPLAPVGYQALYESTTRWVRRAALEVPASRLPGRERSGLARAALHTLRHTCFTTLAEAGVPIDVIQAQAGHADPRTSARYTKARIRRVQAEVGRVFG